MNIEQFNALRSLIPEASCFLEEGKLRWNDERSVPSIDEINQEVERLKLLEPARIATQNRRATYIAEADPLFFKAQRGEATMEEWQAKVAEIKARFPK